MATYLRLTGISSITGGELNLNGTNATPGLGTIHLDDGWGPRVARRRQSNMGNQSPYAEVTEAPPLWIEGTTVAETRDTLAALASAIDQAELWFRGDGVDPVIVHYRLDGSLISTPLQAAMVGGGNSTGLLELPATFNAETQYFVVSTFDYSFSRRGLWLGDEETEISTTLTAPAVMSIAPFSSSSSTASPVDVLLDLGVAATLTARSAILASSSKPNSIFLLESESGTLSNFTSHADTGASGGNVAKYNTGASSGSVTHGSIAVNSDARRFHLFVMMTNNSTVFLNSTDYTLSASLSGGFAGNFSFKDVVFPYSEDAFGRCAVVSMGSVAVPDISTNTTLSVTVVPSKTVTSGNELEIDYTVLVEESLTSNFVGIQTFSDGGFSEYSEHNIEHRLLTAPTPQFRQVVAGDNDYTPYDGNLSLDMEGLDYDAIIMAWRTSGFIVNSSFFLSATRRLAYLVPQ